MSSRLFLAFGIVVACGFLLYIFGFFSGQKNTMRDEARGSLHTNQGGSRTYQVNPEMSRIEWTGYAVGKKHLGQVNVKSSTLVIVDGALREGDVVVDMTSISNDDLGSKTQNKLVAHLKSNDFFAVADYPEAKMVVTKVENTEKANEYRVAADVTIKDVTNEVVFDVIVDEINGSIALSASFDIDRTLWGVTFGSEKFSERVVDEVISDTISFDIALIGTIGGGLAEQK